MSSEQQDLADLLQKKHSLIEAKSHAAERGDLLGEIHQKVKRVHSSPTSFAQALALLRELSGDLKGKADGASVELLSRAVGLLHKWRMGTGNPTEVARRPRTTYVCYDKLAKMARLTKDRDNQMLNFVITVRMSKINYI